jgi:WD40 repeat protein
MWRLSRTRPDSGSDSPGKPVFVSYNNLLDESVLPTTTATGLSWSPDGSLIAVASEPVYEGTSKVEFWSADGKSFTSYNQFDSPILCLRWNLTNTTCLSLSPQNEGRGTTITIMIPTMGESVQFILPHRALLEQPLDAAWVTDEEFFICGGDVLQGFIFANNTICLGRKFETRENDGLSKVTYDWRSRLLATASDSGTIDVRLL